MTLSVKEYSATRKTKIRLPTERSDELGILARTFDSMITRINTTQTELERLNSDLEKTVELRTQSLKDSEGLQETILEAMSDALLTTTRTGVIRSINQAALTMFDSTPELMIGNNIRNYISELDSNNITEMSNALSMTEYLNAIRENNETFPIEIRINEAEFSGEVIYTTVIRDVTERLKSEKLKDEFVSTVSHELRTPLTAIKGALNLMSSASIVKLPTQAEYLLKIASNNTERLLVIINDILDLQKIESDEMTFIFANTTINSIIEQAIIDNTAYADQLGVKFINCTQDNNINVWGDEGRLMQVMANLLSNAAKFSPQGGTIEVWAEHTANGFVRISVKDHGEGIPLSFYNKIFEKSSQFDASDTRRKSGTRLGLSISKTIIEKHGGEIDFISQESSGTTFSVSLPEIASFQYGNTRAHKSSQ